MSCRFRESHDIVLRKDLYYWIRVSRKAEKYVRALQYLYEGRMTAVGYGVGATEVCEGRNGTRRIGSVLLLVCHSLWKG